MNWRDIVARWLVDKKAMLEGNLGTMELVQLFVERNIVPARLMDNDALHTCAVDADHVGNVKGYSRTSSSSRKYIYLLYECQRGHELGHG